MVVVVAAVTQRVRMFSYLSVSCWGCGYVALKSVRPNLVAFLVLFGIEFSFIVFISSSVTLTKREAAILKFSALATITSREMIIARHDAILDQSERENLYNHLNNYRD